MYGGRKQPDGWKIRTPPKLHFQLKAAAAQHDWSLNAEAVERLERSFDLEDWGGPRLAEIVKTMAKVMVETGQHAAFFSCGKLMRDGTWLTDPYAFEQALRAATRVVESYRPPGKVVVPRIAAAKIVEGRNERIDDIDYLLKNLGDLLGERVAQTKENKQ